MNLTAAAKALRMLSTKTGRDPISCPHFQKCKPKVQEVVTQTSALSGPRLLKHPPAVDAKFWELMNNSHQPPSRLNDVTLWLLSVRISSLLSPNHLNGSLISLSNLTEAAAFKTQHTSIHHFCIPASLPQPLSALPSYSPLSAFLSLFF